MYYKKLLRISAWVVISIFFVSCSQEDVPVTQSEYSSFQNLYNEMSNVPTTSVMGIMSTQSRGEREYSLPILMDEDFNYLNSLSQKDFQDMENSILSTLGTLENFASYQDSKLDRLYDNLGGVDQLEKFKLFSSQYMEMEQGWDNISKILPKGLSDKQMTEYISKAVYIDKIGRPMLRYMQDREIMFPLKSRDADRCKSQLERDLVGAGSALSAEEFLTLMSGGTLELVDAVLVVVDAFDIWHRYEECNGRFH